MSTVQSSPTPKSAAITVAFITLPLALLIGCACNMICWIGGPVAFYGGFLSAFLWASIAYSLCNKGKAHWGAAISVGLCGWALSEAILFPVGDQIESTRLQGEAMGKALALGRGELPPNCQVGLPYRAMPRTPLICKAPVAEVVEFYRHRLDSSFVRTRDAYGIRYDNGSKGLLISSTEYGCDVDVW